MSAARPIFRPSHDFLPGHRPRAVSTLTVALGTLGSAIALVLGPVGLGVASAQVAPAGPSAAPSAASAAASPASSSSSSSPSPSASLTGSAALVPLAVGPGITAALTFSKTGTDASTGSTADSSTGTVGTTGPGHTINWVLNYHNSTGSSASVNMTDPFERPDVRSRVVEGPARVQPAMVYGRRLELRQHRGAGRSQRRWRDRDLG